MADLTADLSRAGTEAIRAGFEVFIGERGRITARARERFERRAWAEAQDDARERLDLGERIVNETVGAVRAELGGAAHDREVWRRLKDRYLAAVEGLPAAEIALTFFNSVTRRVFATVGVDRDIEFLAMDAPAPRTAAFPVRTFRREVTTDHLLRKILEAFGFGVPYEDLARDARLAAIELDAHLRELRDGQPIDAVEMAAPVFFRGKGAYLAGRIRRGRFTTPLVLALVHGERGIVLDAALFTPEDVSIVFSFTRSYFHVEAPSPRDLVGFLSSLLPQKRRSELYISIGFEKHGKTEMYRELVRHLEESGDRFVPARGDRGLVMTVFTLPGLELVFKVIKDVFAPPKQTTRREVMDKYRHVFRHDRAGRLVDAQEFRDLEFPLARFSPEVLEELRGLCAGSIEERGGLVRLKHLYAERRLMPLNLFIREADEWTARQAVLDFGQALRDLAATNTFPGDLLLKNFGVTRNRRVIFYDYDELARVTECNFRDMPSGGGGPGGGDDDDLYGWGGSSEPAFYVGKDDVFPEEFLPFLGLPGRLRQVFLEAHGELLSAGWWRGMQERVRHGEIVDIYPYREQQRLRYAWPDAPRKPEAA
ncbi:MAG: bifunctional isocitrate dehydrogenase kinase/phosphatase [Anaeromyxobacter sp.]